MSVTLRKKKILITRERNQAKKFAKKVLQFGGVPIEVPLLKIACKDSQADSYPFQHLHHYKWIFFTSSNGVDCFFKRANLHHCERKVSAECKLAAVGHKTAQALEGYGYHASFIPTTYNADVMASEFLSRFKRDETPILLVRGNRSRDVLPEVFTKQNISFDSIVVYETLYNFQVTDELNRVLNQEDPDFITFTSPSTVEAFFKMDEGVTTSDAVHACIGTTTEKRAEELGFTNIIAPTQFTIDGMLEEISKYIAKKG